MAKPELGISFLYYLKYIMLYTGTLPPGLVTFKWYTLYRYATQTCSLLFLVLMCTKIPFILNDKDKLVQSLNIIGTYSIMFVNVAVCLSKTVRHLIYEMVSTEEQIKASKDQDILNICRCTVQRIKYIQWFYIIMIYSFLVPFLATPFFKYYVYWDKPKYNSSSAVDRPLPYNFWLPFDEEKYYLAGFGLCSYCAVLAMGYYCYTQSIFIILPSYISFRLKVLQTYIRNNKEYLRKLRDNQEDNDNNVVNIFRFCAKEHIGIIRTVKNVNDSVKFVMLLQFLMSSGQISLVLFQIISVNLSFNLLVFSMLHVFLLMTQLLILYWHADEIREQSIAVATVLYYEVDWYTYNQTIKSNIHIMMMRAQRPLSLTIGPFGEMSLEMALKTNNSDKESYDLERFTNGTQ